MTFLMKPQGRIPDVPNVPKRKINEKKISFAGLIKQFLRDVDWGDVDYLVIDTPPGTSDEHLSVVQYLKNAGVDGAIVITTPQVKF